MKLRRFFQFYLPRKLDKRGQISSNSKDSNKNNENPTHPEPYTLIVQVKNRLNNFFHFSLRFSFDIPDAN